MKRRIRLCLLGLLALMLSACGAAPAEPGSAGEPVREDETTMLQMTIGQTPVTVDWEENEAVNALKALCQDGPLTIAMSMYGGFEQVGPIGERLPGSDRQTTTRAGDIVLYSGDQLVVFYGSNSWAYTRLGHISDRSDADMAALLGAGDVTITLEVTG